MAVSTFLSLCFPQTHTHKQDDIIAQDRISDGPSLRKKPQIQPKIWIKNLILNSGGSDLSCCGVWLLAIAPFLIALSLSLPFSSFLSLELALSNFGQLFHTVKRGESSFNFANNASVCASAVLE